MSWALRSKIHKAIVTETNLNYIGSVGTDKPLMEKVLVVDKNNKFVRFL